MQKFKHLSHSSLSIALLGLLAPGLLVAQTPDAGSLLRDIETQDRGIDRLPSTGSQLPPAMPDTGATVQLRSIRFQGHEGMATENELQTLVGEEIGRQLGFNGLQHIADRVTEYLKNKGYFLAYAYLPEQDISEGDLLILIQPGRIEGEGRWQRNPTAGQGINLSSDRIFNTLNHSLRADSDGIVRANQMERGLLIFNDLAGVSARSNLEAGSEPGTTRVSVNFTATPRYTGNAWVDNYGNRYTGTWRANAMGNINNLSGMGDQLNAMVSKTSDLTYARMGYNTPVGYSGLTFNAGLSYMQYELGKELRSSDLSGEAMTANAGLRYPIIRTRQNNLYVTGNLDYKLLEDKQGTVQLRDRKYTNLTLGLNGDKLDQWQGGGLTNYGVSFTSGDLDRKGNSGDYDQDQATAKTHGAFTKANLNAARLQKLAASTSLLMSASGQYTENNLDSAEKFALGGPNGVRAYPGGEASGDQGYILTLEGRYDLPGLVVWGGNIQLNAFIDHGSITLQADKWATYDPKNVNTNGQNSYSMTGAGIGFNWSQAQKFSVRASYAHKINDSVDDRSTSGRDSENQKNDGRFWLQAMAWF